MEPRDTFISERLVLRRSALTDTLAVYEYASDSEVTRFMDWATHQNARDAMYRELGRWNPSTLGL